MKLSIVATLYRSSPYIEEFLRRATAAARTCAGDSFEIILVNDGSPDDSLARACASISSFPNLTVIDLSRNFGHHPAMMTGLKASIGEHVFLIDSDLEESPEWLNDFFVTKQIEKCDVVFGVQESRKGDFFERITGGIFYSLFRILTGIDQPNNIVTARLMSRRYVDALLSHNERELNIGGLWIVTGFRQIPNTVSKLSHSPTTYTLSRKIGHLVNAVTSFSSLPLVFTFYAGTFISSTAVCFILYLVFRYLFISAPPDGYTSLIASIWLFSGLIIFFVGIQGIYLSKVFTEVKQRPLTVVRQIFRREGAQ